MPAQRLVPLKPAPGAVEVWAVSFAQLEPGWRYYQTVLSTDESAKAQRYRFDVHRIRYIAGRGFIRHCLASLTQQNAAELQLAQTDHGKPYWLPPYTHDIELQFNVSHSDTHLVLAVAAGAVPIGIDIEPYQHNTDLTRLAESQFSEEEQLAIQAVSKDTDKLTTRFFNIWTRKEAVVKALGGGLSIPLASFDTSHVNDTDNALLGSRWQGLARGQWRLLDMPLVDDHAGALCCAAETRTLQLHTVKSIQHIDTEHRVQITDTRHQAFDPDNLHTSA